MGEDGAAVFGEQCPAAGILGEFELRVALKDEEGVIAGELHQVRVGKEVAEPQRREPALRRAEQIARAAQPQVGLGDLEAVAGLLENAELFERLGIVCRCVRRTQ